jgi:rhodanese-related sulfurtransferase
MVQQIRPEQVSAKLQNSEPVYFLDVRQPWEYDLCRIAGSLLIPLPELPSRVAEIEAPEGATIVVYCHHGVRSLSGASILQQAGLANVVSLSGGIEAWSVQIDPKVPRY